MAVGGLREEAADIQKGVAEWVDRFDIMREPSDKNSRTQVQGGRHHQVHREPYFYIRQYIQLVVGRSADM